MDDKATYPFDRYSYSRGLKKERQTDSVVVAVLFVDSVGNSSPLAAVGVCRVGKPSRNRDGWLMAVFVREGWGSNFFISH